jgi:hypothetical protein
MNNLDTLIQIYVSLPYNSFIVIEVSVSSQESERSCICVIKVSIRLFRIISILSKFCYFRPPDHVISMELLALNFRCQCTQQKLQSIYAVLSSILLTFSVKDRYQLNYFICIKDFNAETNTSLKLNLFSFFICGCQHHQRKTICLYVYISDIRQIVGYRTPVFIQRFPWRLHITITYNLPHLRL